MRVPRRPIPIALIGLGIILLIGLLGLGLLLFMESMTRPADPGPAAYIARARLYDVRIKRDRFGVPHVFGKTDRDVAFGFAFAHSEDDFKTIQEAVLATRGTLAAVEGSKAAPTDYLVQLMNIWPVINARYDKDLPADFRGLLQAYADGVNDYAARHPGLVVPGLLPVTGKDVVAGFMFKMPFFYGLDGVLSQLTQSTKGRALPTGSNGVALAPSRTDDGSTRLLVNSHQPYEGPVAWYEAVLQSAEGWHVAGGFFPGSPFMLHGHNEHLGWASTVDHPNLATVYRLTMNPANPDEYRLDGRWVRFAKSQAKLKVHVWGPLTITVSRPLLWSLQGPVLKTDHGVFAIRYAGAGEMRQALQYYRMDKARSLEEWRSAMAMQAIPALNFLYADEKGHIGYLYNGDFPNRKAGVDWTAVQPGDRSDLIWSGYLPVSADPQIWDPKSGYVFNSNNTPFRATGAEDQLKPADYPAAMGIQTNMTNRALRAEETFGTDPKITLEAFRRYKFDLRYSKRSDVAALIAKLTAEDPRGDRTLKEDIALLKTWDFSTDIRNRAAALAVLTAQPVLSEGQGPKPTPLAALKAADGRLRRFFGRIDPQWGDVNRIVRGRIDLPIDGGPDTYRAVYGEPRPDGTLKAAAGDTFIMFVSWDRSGRVSSESIHQFGSATSVPSSPHYADQTPLFAAMKTKPVYFTREALQGHVEADYRPGAAHPP